MFVWDAPSLDPAGPNQEGTPGPNWPQSVVAFGGACGFHSSLDATARENQTTAGGTGQGGGKAAVQYPCSLHFLCFCLLSPRQQHFEALHITRVPDYIHGGIGLRAKKEQTGKTATGAQNSCSSARTAPGRGHSACPAVPTLIQQRPLGHRPQCMEGPSSAALGQLGHQIS